MNSKKMMYAFLLMLISGNYALGMADMTNNEILLHAARRGNIERVQDAINAGADINVQDEYSSTALMFAVRTGRLDIVRLLLNYDADINVQNDGWTAFTTAILCKDFDIVQFLLNRGADVNAQDNNGQTALNYAEELSNDHPARQQIIEALQEAVELANNAYILK